MARNNEARELCNKVDEAKQASKWSRWNEVDDGVLIPVKRINERDHLEPGYYDLVFNDGQIIFNRKELLVDDLIAFEEGYIHDIVADIDAFWEKGPIFKHYGFLHKRGYLFHGRAGTGKTSLVHLLIHQIVAKGGLVLPLGSCDTPVLRFGLKVLREIEPDKKIIVLMEDLDAIFQSRNDHELLALLDGEDNIDNCLFVATTNYPENLDKRISQRPRRFDRVIEIKSPDSRTRAIYFNKKLKIEGDELDRYVRASDGFTFAAMVELVISTKCLDGDFDQTVATLNRLLGTTAHSADHDGGAVKSTTGRKLFPSITQIPALERMIATSMQLPVGMFEGPGEGKEAPMTEVLLNAADNIARDEKGA